LCPIQDAIVMKEIEQKLLDQPDGAFSDVDTRVSYYWIFEERIAGFPRSQIHVGKIKAESFGYESALVLRKGDEVLSILGGITAQKLRKVVNGE
jgi:hypothetical protein